MAEESPPTLRTEELDTDQRLRWRRGERVLVEFYLRRYPSLQSDTERVLQLINNEVVLREELEGHTSPEEYLERFPQLHAQIEELFEVHRALESDSVATVRGEDVPQPAAGWPVVEGYEILTELGRGGMGVVYRARQTTLGREVALKVPRPGTLLSGEFRERFVREARAAALLDHPNLVPVYEVGTAGALCFIASAYCPGITLSQWLARRTESVPARLAAQLVATLAGASQHAHARGVIHRDLKPSNVLLQGRPRNSGDPNATVNDPGGADTELEFVPRITDFGLAKLTIDPTGQPGGEDGGAGTQSGALLGTPNYMAPEQASGKSREVGPAADVYALGVILYELLTGRPPFLGETVLDTLEQVRSREPLPPHRLRPKLSRDLETICLKCLEKEPRKRYASAAALADDLHRYLTGAPILARPIRSWERGIKWARRKPAVATLWAVGLAALLAGTGWKLWSSWEQVERRSVAELALREAETRQEAGSNPATWNGRYAAAQRAESLVGRVSGAEELQTRVQQLLTRLADEERDRHMLARLEEIRLLEGAAVKDGMFDIMRADPEYARAFQDYGIDVEDLVIEEAAARIRERPVCQQLAAALDHWAFTHRYTKQKPASWRRLLEIARRADPDEWRNRLRDALDHPDRQALLNLADEGERVLAVPSGGANQSPPTLALLGRALTLVGDIPSSVRWLRQVQRRHPNDFWFNHELGMALKNQKPAQREEAVRYLTAAVALHPDSPGAHHNLASALADSGRWDEAIAECRETLRLKKDYPEAHSNLGICLHNKGQLDLAAAEFREAIRLNKDHPLAHKNLGFILYGKGQRDEALAEYRQAVRISPDDAEIHNNLGVILREKSRPDEAIVEHREAIRIKEDFPEAHNNLGYALSDKGRLEEAILEFREAIRIKKDYHEAHYNLGTVFHKKGQLDEAIREYREAIRFHKDFPQVHSNLGVALEAKGFREEAIVEYREAIRLNKDDAAAHYNLGIALSRKGQLEEAIAEHREAVRLKRDDAVAHYNFGNFLYGQGRLDEAIVEYREAIRLNKDHAPAHYNLGNVLYYGKGRLDEAIAEYRMALRLKEDALTHNNLGNALRDRGRLDYALIEYREAIRIQKDYPEAHNNLGFMLQGQGRFAEALAALKRGHELGSRQADWNYPSAQWVREAERLVELENRLPALRKGEYQPRDNTERLELAKVCGLKKLHLTAVRLYADAFAAQPALADDLKQAHRYNAACAAALAAAGQGEEASGLDDQQRGAGARRRWTGCGPTWSY